MSRRIKNSVALLETSKVSVAVEIVGTSALAIKDSDKFLFEQQPSFLPNMVMQEGRVIAESGEHNHLIERWS